VRGLARRLDDQVAEGPGRVFASARRQGLGDAPDAIGEVAENFDRGNGADPCKEPRA
jgi:hypothetical protein